MLSAFQPRFSISTLLRLHNALNLREKRGKSVCHRRVTTPPPVFPLFSPLFSTLRTLATRLMENLGSTAAAIACLFALLVTGCDRSESLQSVASTTVAEPDLLTTKCGVCHAVPSPVAHTAAEWPMVVMRMQGRRSAQGFAPLTDDEVSAITERLQENAKK